MAGRRANGVGGFSTPCWLALMWWLGILLPTILAGTGFVQLFCTSGLRGAAALWRFPTISPNWLDHDANHILRILN